ncbi:AraC family transcriptional regulator [Actinoplanes sp. NPDC051513]|uniref:AraC family transcriptional regulator n=1 Tax=Actinoplanes sp. NPDC051513 TaxID=3363908 RepID=UPI003796177D
MGYEVVVSSVGARPTAVVRAKSSWADFPRAWKPMLDQVWERLHAAGITRGCPNVMLYLDDIPHVEVGVLLSAPIPLGDPVVASELPGGRVATTIHRGPYDRLGAAHEAILSRGLPLAGPRWEIYGPHQEIPETQISYLLRETAQ